MDGIKRIPLRDANEHTLITEVIYPMINALESKLDANLLAVEDFWEQMYAQEGQSVKQQNRVLLNRYLQSLKVRIQSLTGNDMVGAYAFDENLKTIKKNYLECDDFPDHAHWNFIFGEGGIKRETNKATPVYYISPFTVVKPQLKGNYNQPADFINATEVLTISKPVNRTRYIQNHLEIPPLYWMRIDWKTLSPMLDLNTQDWNKLLRRGDDGVKVFIHELDSEDTLRVVNVYKLVQFFDDPNNPMCFENSEGKPVIRDMLFKLSFAAIPTKEGYRLAPASFTAIKIGEGNKFSYFLETLKMGESEGILEVINNYPAQGLFNWNNL
tara:strand:+ start:265 stop:1242 length:978 start_codon:yes stop_codon:yes gene_type:complete